MMLPLDRRPVVVAIAGPNGAGKSTFYHSHLEPAALRFLNPDLLAKELQLDPYAAAAVAASLRNELVKQRESFVFEPVFSDPVGDKLDFLSHAAEEGYTVVLCFIGISGPEISAERVAMRVSQGGHDVPFEKIVARYPRTMANLSRAIACLSFVYIFDNTDLSMPFRLVAEYQHGVILKASRRLPECFKMRSEE